MSSTNEDVRHGSSENAEKAQSQFGQRDFNTATPGQTRWQQLEDFLIARDI